MKFKIGFTAEKETEKKAPEAETKAPEEAPARESLVRVYFPQRGFDCTIFSTCMSATSSMLTASSRASAAKLSMCHTHSR